MPKTILLWHFDEPDALQPSDAAGNLDDLGTEPGIAAPTSVATWEGLGRRFLRASSQALFAPDITGRDTLLQRDVTIQALMSLTLTGAAGPHTVIARGLNDGSTSERYAFGLELEEQATPGQVEVRLFWQDSAGNVKTAPPGVFQHPGDGAEFLLTATRRWERTDKVVVRYYVGDELIAELETADGDISGGTVGHTSVGARKAAGAWGRFLNGTIDELLVTDHEMTLDEIRWTWARLTQHQPGGVETMVALAPAGLGWADDLGNNQGRLLKITGEALGLAVAHVEQLREFWLPDRATHEQNAEWERLSALTAKPRESLDTRRARTLAFMGREQGFHHAGIQAALAEVLDTQPANVEILEFTNEQTDGFAALDTDERWLAGATATWSVLAGELRLEVPAATDLRWSTIGDGCALRMSADTGGGDFHAHAKIASVVALPASTGAGMLLTNRVTGDALFFGVYNNAGTYQLGWRAVLAGAEGAWTSLVALGAVPPATPIWLRIAPPTGAVSGTGEYRFGYSTSGPNSGFTTAQITTNADALQWFGFGAFSTIAAPVAGIDARFDDFLVFAPYGLRPFEWYAYRDPALLGAPDMIGGQLVVDKVKPAHTDAGACESLSVLAGDDRYGLCGRGPCGGF